MDRPGASQQFFHAAREEFPDPTCKRFDGEGFPSDLESLLKKQRKVSFSLGSSTFNLTFHGMAEVTFPEIICPINWKYLEMFLEFLGDMPEITGVILIIPANAKEDSNFFDPGRFPSVKALLARTCALIQALNKDRPVENASFITLQGPTLQHPFVFAANEAKPPPAILLSDAATEFDKARRRADRSAYEAGEKGKPAELWFMTTRAYEGPDDSTKAAYMKYPASYGYSAAADAICGQIDYQNNLEVHAQQVWYDKILGNKYPIVVYVHGYANTLTTAIESAENLWSEIAALKAVSTPVNVILFSWPSRGGRFGAFAYGYDLDRITMPVNVAAFKGLLSKLLAVAADRTSLMAHSMGNILLMSTLGDMASRAELSRGRAFQAVFSVAAAVVAQYWAQDAFKYYRATKLPIFLCCSSADWALYAMEWKEHDPAVGLLTGMPLCSPVHHTIEVPAAIASSLDGKGHSYFTTPTMVKLFVSAILSDSWVPLAIYELTDPYVKRCTGSWHVLADVKDWKPTPLVPVVASLPAITPVVQPLRDLATAAPAPKVPPPKPDGSPATATAAPHSEPAADPLASLLEAAGLEHFLPKFKEEAVDSVSQLRSTKDAELEELGLTPANIKQLRTQLALSP